MADLSLGQGKPKRWPPSCVDCGRATYHLVGDDRSGHAWVCGECEYRRAHPDAEAAKPLPREARPKALQRERLFDA